MGRMARRHDGPMDHVTPLEQALHAARALVLADLAAGEVADGGRRLPGRGLGHAAPLVGRAVAGGRGFVAGLVAQDVQDALLERYGRWPLCPVCGAGDPHALEVEPELGPDPHWVCHKAGVRVAAVGALGAASGGMPPS